MGDKEQLDDLFEKMVSLEIEDEGDFDNLISALDGNPCDIRDRAGWFDLEKESDSFHFNVESAWSEPRELNAFLEEKYRGLKFYFIAEEPAMEYFVTNDVDGVIYDKRFEVIMHETGDWESYTESEQDVFLRAISKITGQDITALEDVKKAIFEYNDDKDWDERVEYRIYKVKE